MGENISINKIIDKLSEGNESAFEKLFKLYYPRLKNYAYYFLKNNDEAEDLVQDVFFQIWENRQKLTSEKHFASFIFTLLKNRCLNSIKRKVVEDNYMVYHTKHESEEIFHISFEMESGFSTMEERLTKELENLIHKMPERCGAAFRLKWFEGKKIHEIASIMKISTTMVDKHLAKGFQIARNTLTPDLFLFLIITRS